MFDSYGHTIEVLHDVAINLQSQDTIENVCELTVNAAAEILDFNQCTVIIREGEWLVPYAISKDAPEDGSRRMRLDQGLAGKTYQTGESYLVEKVEPDDETDPAKPDYRSGISVPIAEYGVFQAVSKTESAFDDEDIELAELLISHTQTALDRIEREQELQRQVERLDQFASVVSHDLRTPLTVAQGNLRLARDEQDSDPLEKVATAHDRMDRLIDDLLTFARAGAKAIDPEPVELAQLAKDCWAGLEHKNGTLHTKTQQSIFADRERLRQLIENLFSNAIKYGGEDVSITIGDTADGFYVEDDGEGIPADERSAVFEAGYSLGTDGTGFGLGIVKQVVKAHEWEIRVVEGTNGGARFEIAGVK